jgi:hypothetical protein
MHATCFAGFVQSEFDGGRNGLIVTFGEDASISPEQPQCIQLWLGRLSAVVGHRTADELR